MDLDTIEKVRVSATIDPELELYLKANPIPPMSATLPELKAGFAARMDMIRSALGAPPPAVIQTDHLVPVRDGTKLQLRSYRPSKPPTAGCPLIFLLHGGGWTVGSLEGEELFARNLVSQLGVGCTSLEYRLAPDHPFPTPVHDAWDALLWVDAHASTELYADLTLGFIVGGTSAGANLAAVLCHESLSPANAGILRHNITGQALNIPSLMSFSLADPATKSIVPAKYRAWHTSREQNATAPVLPESFISLLFSAYKPDIYSPLFAPILYSDSSFAQQPPAHLVVCGMDTMRDDGLIYERVLREHGVKTKLDFWPGLPHSSMSLFPGLESSKRQRRGQVEGVRWLLGMEEEKVDGEEVEEEVVPGFG